MKMNPLIALGFLVFAGSLGQAQTTPAWFDTASYIQKAKKQARADGVVFKGTVVLEKSDVKKVDLGGHQFTMVVARVGGGNSEESGGYLITEVRGEPAGKPKLLFQSMDKTGCRSQVGENLVGKKLGFVNDIQVYFLQVHLVAPTCGDSDLMSPKIFLVVQGLKNQVDKVYQSDVSENGKFRIGFSKSQITLEYAKNIKSESVPVLLMWDASKQRFVPESP